MIDDNIEPSGNEEASQETGLLDSASVETEAVESNPQKTEISHLEASDEDDDSPLERPDWWPENFWKKDDAEPDLQAMAKYGVSQAALDTLVGKVVEMGFEANQTSSVNLAEEKKALGPNADARINGMVKWASGLVNKGIWGKEDFEEFKYMGGTAKGIAALEKLRGAYEGRVPTDSAPVQGALSKEELYAMVGDPKYQTDPGFRKKVERMFEANFGS